LNEGCYDLILADSYGDGMGGSQWAPDCTIDGSMELSRNTNGQIVAQLLEADADFGDTISFNFCAQNLVNLAFETLENNITVYPNPSNGIFTIEMPGFDGEKVIKLLDVTGKIVSIQSTFNNSLELNEVTLIAGIYIASIQTEMGTITRKVIVQ
jgi:hypothetical protein